MKKLIFLSFILSGFLSWAQVRVGPAFRAGINIASLTQSNTYSIFNHHHQTNQIRDIKSKIAPYFGVGLNLRLSNTYALQPELGYTEQGAELTIFNPNTQTEERKKLSNQYISIQLTNKFHFGEQKNLNLHITPFIDVMFNTKYLEISNQADIGLSLGLGYEFKNNFGIESRIKKGFINVLSTDESNHKNTIISLGATYTFRSKKENSTPPTPSAKEVEIKITDL